MQPVPQNMAQFFSENHVVSIATSSPQGLWSACCFYVFDAENAQLIVFTARTTQHGANMAAQPNVAGTIAGQPHSIAKINGIQFTAQAVLLNDDAAGSRAKALFYKVHPAARAMNSDVWALRLATVKFTDNKLVFAKKTLWQRDEAA